MGLGNYRTTGLWENRIMRPQDYMTVGLQNMGLWSYKIMEVNNCETTGLWNYGMTRL